LSLPLSQRIPATPTACGWTMYKPIRCLVPPSGQSFGALRQWVEWHGPVSPIRYTRFLNRKPRRSHGEPLFIGHSYGLAHPWLRRIGPAGAMVRKAARAFTDGTQRHPVTQANGVRLAKSFGGSTYVSKAAHCRHWPLRLHRLQPQQKTRAKLGVAKVRCGVHALAAGGQRIRRGKKLSLPLLRYASKLAAYSSAFTLRSRASRQSRG
jgi:hypothetical protein